MDVRYGLLMIGFPIRLRRRAVDGGAGLRLDARRVVDGRWYLRRKLSSPADTRELLR
eukprot:m.203702 g.203702  ORF g.203702 m.203702 type:complete len:57 (-) comp22211_c0_seq1:683-853(-)